MYHSATIIHKNNIEYNIFQPQTYYDLFICQLRQIEFKFNWNLDEDLEKSHLKSIFSKSDGNFKVIFWRLRMFLK